MIAIGAPTGLQKGRGGFLRSADDAPYVTDPTGDLVKSGERKGEVKRVKYGSPSKAGTLIENDVGLTKYKQDYIFLGIGMSDEIREMCVALVGMEFGTPEYRKAANTIVVEADKITRSWLAADRGSHGHLLCELVDRYIDTFTPEMARAGKALGLDTATQVGVVNAWRNMLADNGLDVLRIEASCVDDRWRLAGTLDRIVRTTRPLTFVKPDGELVVIPANTVLILDIKFGQARHAHLIQIASYAHSVPYDTDTETRGVWPWTISDTHALIAHGDFGDDTRPVTIELMWVDLAAGRDHGGRCMAEAKLWSARDDLWSVAQIVEGTVRAEDPVPSTPVLAATADDLRAATAGEGHADTSPAPSERLALVQARDALCPSPDEGADWSSDEFAPLWDELKALFDDLDSVARSWRAELAGQAKRRGVDFLAQGGRTERRYYINKAVVALATTEWATDEILRELLAYIIGDVALFPAIEAGHALGSLNASEAERFAAHVDAYLSPLPVA